MNMYVTDFYLMVGWFGWFVLFFFFFSVKCQPFPDERGGGEFHTFFLLCVETWVLMVLEQVVFYKEWGCLLEWRESRKGRGGEEGELRKLPLAAGISWIILHCFYSEHVNVTLFAECIFFLWNVGVQYENNPLF